MRVSHWRGDTPPLSFCLFATSSDDATSPSGDRGTNPNDGRGAIRDRLDEPTRVRGPFDQPIEMTDLIKAVAIAPNWSYQNGGSDTDGFCAGNT